MAKTKSDTGKDSSKNESKALGKIAPSSPVRKAGESQKNLKDMAGILDKLESVGIPQAIMSGERHYSGPLPLQLLNKLDKEQCDKLVDDMVQSRKRNQENQAKFMDLVFGDEAKERVHETIKYIFCGVVIAGIFLSLIFTGNSAILKEYLPVAFAFVGGSGFVMYKVNAKKSPKIEIDDK
jgi:hypothetical protein